VLGYAASVQVASSVAAPLLAAASFTLISILLPYADEPHRGYAPWPAVTLSLLVVAAGFLLASVQCGVTVRRYDVSPGQLIEYAPEARSDPQSMARLRAEQASYAKLAEVWSNRTRWTYHLGIVMLLAAMTFLVIPTGRVALSGWLPFAAASLILIAEMVWIADAVWTLGPRVRRAMTNLRTIGRTVSLWPGKQRKSSNDQ